MKRFRFSLRIMILIVTALALLLGFSQYRRHSVLEICAELEEDGYVFSVPGAWHDKFFQRKPIVGHIRGIKQDEILVRAMKRYEQGRHVGTILDETSDRREIDRLKRLEVVKLP